MFLHSLIPLQSLFIIYFDLLIKSIKYSQRKIFSTIILSCFDELSMASLTPKEEEDLRIPRTAVNKLIKDFIPDVRVSNDAREFITECCNVFVHRLTREANQICESQQKKTMSHDHVLAALDKVGLTPYRDQVEAVMQEVISKKHRQSTRLENLGLSEEELYRQQQELFNQARQEQLLLDERAWNDMQSAAPIVAQLGSQSTSQNPNSYDDEEEDY